MGTGKFGIGKVIYRFTAAPEHSHLPTPQIARQGKGLTSKQRIGAGHSRVSSEGGTRSLAKHIIESRSPLCLLNQCWNYGTFAELCYSCMIYIAIDIIVTDPEPYSSGKYPKYASADIEQLNLIGQVRHWETIAEINRCRCSSLKIGESKKYLKCK